MGIKIFLAIVIFCSLVSQNIFSKSNFNFDPKLKFNSAGDYSKLLKERDYKRAVKHHKKITNSLFGASVDFQLGYGTTSGNGETVNSGSISSDRKGGFQFGAILNLNLFNVLNFSTGLDFTKKNFGLGIPYTNPQQVGDSVVKSLSNNYMNIPMNLYFGGMVSEKVGVYVNGGPYFGILLNAENAESGFKNFDLGLNGTITGKYFLNQFVSIILGTKIQYGGLNNLWNSGSVEKMHTLNWGGFSGVSVGF